MLVEVQDRRGHYEMTVPVDDHIGMTLRATGRPYEHRMLATLSRLVGPGDLVADVGGNIGNHTVSFARGGST